MTYRDRVIEDGATNYWRLGEQSGTVARDEIGGADATISGNVTLGQPGALADGNKAMAIRDTGRIGTVANVTIPVVATVECWLQRFGPPPFLQSPVVTLGSGQSPALHIMGVGDDRVAIFDPQGGFQLLGTMKVQAGVHHLVYVFGSTAISSYLDGVVNGNAIPYTRPAPETNLCYLGCDPAFGPPGTAAGFLNGVMDEVAIYALALTPAQILAHYQLGLGQFAEPPSRTSALPLVDRMLLQGGMAVDAGKDNPVDVAGCASLTFYVSTNGTPTQGSLSIEESHDVNYAGDWFTLGGIASVGESVIRLAGTAKAVRARIIAPLANGSVSVRLVAR